MNPKLAALYAAERRAKEGPVKPEIAGLTDEQLLKTIGWVNSNPRCNTSKSGCEYDAACDHVVEFVKRHLDAPLGIFGPQPFRYEVPIFQSVGAAVSIRRLPMVAEVVVTSDWKVDADANIKGGLATWEWKAGSGGILTPLEGRYVIRQGIIDQLDTQIRYGLPPCTSSYHDKAREAAWMSQYDRRAFICDAYLRLTYGNCLTCVAFVSEDTDAKVFT